MLLDAGQELEFKFFSPLLSPENNGRLGERGDSYSGESSIWAQLNDEVSHGKEGNRLRDSNVQS
jgi:hypothetical protein